MAEFEDLEMEDLTEKYPKYDDMDYQKLQSEFDDLTLRLMRNRKYGSSDPLAEKNLNAELNYVKKTMEERLTTRTTLTEGEGETVNITGPSGSGSVPGVEIVEQDSNYLLAKILNVLNDSFDARHADMEYRYNKLKKFSDTLDTKKKKKDFKNTVERVRAVIGVVQLKEKIVLNLKSRYVGELISRSAVKTMNDGTELLMFKSEKGISKSGTQIMKRGKTGVLVYSKNSTALKEYKALVRKIKDEPSTSTQTYTNEAFEGDDEGSADLESDNFPMVDTQVERPYIQGLTPDMNRVLRGVLNPSDSIDPQSRIGDNGALQIQADNYQEKLDETIEQRDKTVDDGEFLDLEETIIALREARDLTLRQRQIEEVRAQQEEDVSRLQRFKENMLGLSSIAITVAGIITTVVIGARTAIIKGVQATSKFAKALANLGKKLGPMLLPLFNMLAKLVSLGAKGLAWLARNCGS